MHMKVFNYIVHGTLSEKCVNMECCLLFPATAPMTPLFYSGFQQNEIVVINIIKTHSLNC